MKIMKLLPVLFLAAIMSMQSCKSLKTTPMENLELLSESGYSEFNQTEQMVIKSDAALQTAYNHILTKQAVPHIDWNKQQVVLLAMGQKNTGGYNIAVEKVVESNNEIVVFYKTISPNAGDRVTQALTSPYVMYTIDNKKDLPVLFKEITE